MANPVNVKWTGPTTYVDGKPYGQADHKGFDIEVNGGLAFSIPVAWSTNNTYSYPVIDLPNLKQGTNAIRMRTVAANGQVSDWTAPYTFQYLSTPSVPTAIVVV